MNSQLNTLLLNLGSLRKYIKILAKDFLAELESIKQNSLRKFDSLQVVIPIHSPGALGGRHTVEVYTVAPGFDWEDGKLFIELTNPVTSLTQQQVDDITESVSKGQSWHAYQTHKEMTNKIKQLETQIEDLQAHISIISKEKETR